jgi:hypothetical protein
MGARTKDGADLGFYDGETLLIGALRRAAAGHQGCALTRRDFAIAFPGDADEVFVTFRAFLATLAHGGRRKLRIGLPGSSLAMPDETLRIALLAAAQASEDELVDAYLCWLTRPGARASVAITARALATALTVHGHWLRVPTHCARRNEPETDETPSPSPPPGVERVGVRRGIPETPEYSHLTRPALRGGHPLPPMGGEGN